MLICLNPVCCQKAQSVYNVRKKIISKLYFFILSIFYDYIFVLVPGLLRIARKLQIDCVPAIVGFEFKKGFTVPMYGGFVVCEEFKDTLIAAWDQEEEEAEKKAADKMEKRVYGNWRKLIKALIIREQLKARYNFGNSPDDDNKKSSESKDKKKARCQKKK